MIKLKVYNFFLLFCLCFGFSEAQNTITGQVISAEEGIPIPYAEIYNKTLSKLTVADANGNFVIEDIDDGSYLFAAFAHQFEVVETEITVNADKVYNFKLPPLAETLSAVILTQRREKIFALRSLKDVEGTAIYAGKKTEVVLLDKITGNLAANNARQIYAQVVGLNIYDNGDAGLQLNIGGRGLDPNRTQNFNTRQNGYDISADVLGYPESYYTPPPEALSEIQLIRGAASLQYGTQFGGLINFKFKKPEQYKPIELVSRQSIGSHDLFTSFNSLSGTVGKFSYYAFYNFKTGEGFRPNSDYESHNAFAHLEWAFSEQTSLAFEMTYLDYLAQQPGGLTDVQFYENPDYSNRTRNWFKVDWLLYALKLQHAISEKTDFSLNFFGLDASRKAVGYRQNRVSQPDDLNSPRELLVDNFSNWGAEARLLTRYNLLQNESVLLVGSKFYKTKNDQRQGPGSISALPDFEFAYEEFPNYDRQAAFEFPNSNLAFFGENIFNVTDKFSVTPGFRFEYINTQAEGSYREIHTDLAGNVLQNEEISDNRKFERAFVLFGIGNSYKFSSAIELYGNFSQNYRSVTFNDIRVVNPVFQVDPNITDEEGFTTDLGLRGRVKDYLSYDMSAFGLKYNGRIGETLKIVDGRLVRFRGNIGDAFIYGLETFADWNLVNSFFQKRKSYKFSLFINAAFTQSEYISSEMTNVEGKEVEFIPDVNLKTGINFGYKNFLGNLQYTYLSNQFTDATNAPQDVNDSQRGIEGAIPAYGVMDFGLSYSYKNFTIETGINNLLDNMYFTRRATGYPGPGIIPAQPRTWYATLQFKW